MNCAEFQKFLPDVIDSDRSAEQEAHLISCPMCSDLVADLDLISRDARQLQEFAEPSPRVWNSIEIVLRQEGLIRESRLGPALVPPVRRSWTLAWLAPVAAIALLAFGILVYERGVRPPQNIVQTPTKDSVAHVSPPPAKAAEDQQLLEAVGSRSPAMQAQYASDLKNVNDYIQDAEQSAQADPNDEEAQQIVMDAYEQRATVYEMALDRSLP